jgi:hypothetical protein
MEEEENNPPPVLTVDWPGEERKQGVIQKQLFNSFTFSQIKLCAGAKHTAS